MLHTFIFYLILIPILGYGKTILIDPGHGGEDHGAKTLFKEKVYFEKDLALIVAKDLEEEFLKSKYRVYLTRSIDRSVTLEERSILADKVQADIVVSVHLNSLKKKKVRGFETYYLDSELMASKSLEKFHELNSETKYSNKKWVGNIIKNIILDQSKKLSHLLASLIHESIAKDVKRSFNIIDRGIRPASFYVLTLSKRPAVLLEVGFMSNSSDLQKILSKKFRRNYVKSVVKGVDEFFKR